MPRHRLIGLVCGCVIAAWWWALALYTGVTAKAPHDGLIALVQVMIGLSFGVAIARGAWNRKAQDRGGATDQH